MPLFSVIDSDYGKLAIWKVIETSDELLSMLPDSDYHKECVERFKAYKRKLEYLAVRALIYNVLGEGYIINYLPSGKPILGCEKGFISISHTAGYVAIIYSEKYPCGIDIEKYSDKVLKVASRFIGPSEVVKSIYDYLLHWSAKETAFKVLDKDGIDFINNLKVENLLCNALHPLQTDTDGSFTLKYNVDTETKGEFKIRYITTSDFVLTFTYKTNA